MDSDPPLSRASRRDFIITFLGQRSRTCLSRKEASPVSGRVRCLSSHAPPWLSLTATCDGVRSASQGVGEAEGACHLLPPMVGGPCCLGGWPCHLTIMGDGLCRQMQLDYQLSARGDFQPNRDCGGNLGPRRDREEDHVHGRGRGRLATGTLAEFDHSYAGAIAELGYPTRSAPRRGGTGTRGPAGSRRDGEGTEARGPGGRRLPPRGGCGPSPGPGRGTGPPRGWPSDAARRGRHPTPGTGR